MRCWCFVLSVGILFTLISGVSTAKAEFGQVNVFVGANQALGGPQTKLKYPDSVAVLPDGSIFITDNGNNRVLRVAANGTVSLFAGTGQQGNAIDQQSATNTQLKNPMGLAVLPDGSILIADINNHRVLKVAVNGTVSIFAGTGQQGNAIDQQSATNTQLKNPIGLAVLPDGSILITDSNNHRVLKVAADGRVSLFAGTGQGGDMIDPQSAANTQLKNPIGLAVLPDGSVLIADINNHRVLRVAANETVSLFAGTGQGGDMIDPQSAANTQLNFPWGFAVLPDGSVLIADTWNHRVLKITTDGAVSTFAGTGQQGNVIDRQSATRTQLNYPIGVAVLLDGSVLISDTWNHRVLIVSPNDNDQQKLQQLVNQGKETAHEVPRGETKLKEVLSTLQTLTRPPEVAIRSLNREARDTLFIHPQGQRALYKDIVKLALTYLKSKYGYRQRAQLALNYLQYYKDLPWWQCPRRWLPNWLTGSALSNTDRSQ